MYFTKDVHNVPPMMKDKDKVRKNHSSLLLGSNWRSLSVFFQTH